MVRGTHLLSMKRDLWRAPLFADSYPGWECPRCKKGHLGFPSVGEFQYWETANSKGSRKQGDWSPDQIEYRFSVVLKCSNGHCCEKATMIGTGSEYYNEPESPNEPEFVPGFTPLACLPMPWIIDVGRKCPPPVSDAIHSACELFWMNPEASALHIRIAVERLLDHWRVPRTTRAKGRRNHLALHHRIERLDGTVKELLLGIKVLGNIGAHGTGEVGPESLLDAFEVLEAVLRDYVEKVEKKIRRIAKELANPRRSRPLF